MRVRDIYDEITGTCDCGGKEYIAYDATAIGFVNILSNNQMGIGHTEKNSQENFKLVVCSNCRKVMVSQTMDATFDAINKIEKEDCMAD